VSYFSRVVAPDEYHFSAAADADNDVEGQRPEDIIEATDEQLAVWKEIYQIAQRRQVNNMEGGSEEDDEKGMELKKRLLEL
jgi:hypothetical protein